MLKNCLVSDKLGKMKFNEIKKIFEWAISCQRVLKSYLLETLNLNEYNPKKIEILFTFIIIL